MSLGLLILCVIAAIAAGALVGNAASKQLEAGEEERQSIGKRARKAATRGALSWLLRRKKRDDD